jgi:hypothetical protein
VKKKEEKGKDLEANIDGEQNERNEKKIKVKGILKNIYSEGPNACTSIRLRVLRDEINFDCFQN